jgi:RNA-binding protein
MNLTNKQISHLKGLAQRMNATLKVGKAGLSESFLQTVREALAHRELIKVKFDDFKDQKKELAPQLAERTESRLVTLIGNVAVLYRQNADPEKRRITLD